MGVRRLELKEGDKLVPIGFDAITIKETGTYNVSGDHFLRLEELEQLKEDSRNLKALQNRSCSNCEYAHNMPGGRDCITRLELQTARALLGLKLTGYSCDLHKPKEV